MKLIVGLGNPGKEYSNTRHNIGYIIVDNYLGKVSWKTKYDSFIYNTEINGEDVIFIKPITYMNLSGLAVKKVVDFYKIPICDILIIQDDLDIPIGSYKIKRNSSSGGHNGIKSIISELNTEEFARLKIGIDKPKVMATDKYVLGKFRTEEIEKIEENLETFKNIIDSFIKEDIEKVMLLYNKN